MRFTKIVVGWDGSPASRAAAEWSAAYALGTPVQIVHAIGGRAVGGEYLAATGERSTARIALMELADALREAHPEGSFETDTVRGAAIDALEERLASDVLVVVGGSSGGRRSMWSLGARLAGRPEGGSVAVIPVASERARPATVAVGIDGTREAVTALEVATAEAHRLGAALTVLHAWDIPAAPSIGFDEYPTESDVEMTERMHRLLLSDALDLARDRGAEPDGRLEMGSAREVLRRAGGASRLLVVGSHGARELARFFLGSVSHSLVIDPPGPVLVVGA
ncbi:universal stress protein [Agrococcus citreus]|uniref:Universal stress protein n=2 Tax=Agrococcus citreus TaxID=84643 RepID=A0ABN1YPY1_9MICO